MKNISFIAFLLFALSGFRVAFAAAPTDLLKAGYSVYQSDVNDDGCNDYLVKAKDVLIVLDLDDVGVPVIVPSKYKPFLIISNVGCTYAISQPDLAVIKSTIWSPAFYEIVISDIKGDGSGSLFLKPTSEAGYIFNVTKSSNSYFFEWLQSIDMRSIIGEHLNPIVTFSPVDEAGNAYMVVEVSSGVADVLASDAEGSFQLEGEASRAASATWVWKRFIEKVAANNIDASLQYVSEASRTGIRAAMTQPDSNLPTFAAAIKQVLILEDDGSAQVQAAVVLSTAGQEETFIVRFAKEEDGIWRIVSM